MKQQELADRLNVTDKAISKWENSRVIPDISLVRELANLFQVKDEEILNGERNFKKKQLNEDYYLKVLEVTNLSKSFGKRKILSNINMNIYEGDIIGLMGSSRAGKTTLMKIILNPYKYDTGNVRICEFDIKTNLEEALSKTCY